ncbi:NlpC/P60 family protein [Streptomyces tubbatahanensis]|uniref:NlpC/P60 family protein n=1 Tax=Streptomyces tubbatahanensis TaxID=2923272 RepID=A0ABY3XQ52_9ACTN|nr:C40 family peptidase [Streptomyces tubbatahanensis]UNS96596.1 NlpC/P60 family protein [Streptomyces tubbatahanensis]
MASHRSPRRTSPPAQGWTARVTVLSAAAAGAAAALTPAPAGADPGADKPSAKSVNARIDGLYEQAEVATEKYNGVAERAGKLREQVSEAQDAIARGQSKVNRLRDTLGGLAGAQYRSGGIDPALTLMLTSDPEGYLDKAATLDRIGSRQMLKLRQLQTAQRNLGQQRTEAAGKVEQLDGLQDALSRQKKSVRKKLSAAKRLLGRLTAQERAERERASRGGRGDDGGPKVGSGGAKASSGRAAAAAAAARSAVGRPYVWGAAGPSSFDCSGLTQWAYAQAGTSIPRTSQAQRSAGRQVPLGEARPGDLIVYRDDASHVAMYMGNGQVVHAPHPGAPVRYDPVGMMPISSVTRP